jgi:hypothetical protein
MLRSLLNLLRIVVPLCMVAACRVVVRRESGCGVDEFADDVGTPDNWGSSPAASAVIALAGAELSTVTLPVAVSPAWAWSSPTSAWPLSKLCAGVAPGLAGVA